MSIPMGWDPNLPRLFRRSTPPTLPHAAPGKEEGLPTLRSTALPGNVL
jgi:hypothetical protein